MDKTIDPCDNFYEFACGGFIKKTEIPSGESHIDSYSILNGDLVKQLHKILAEDIQQNELRAFKLAKILYKSCMNESMFHNIFILIILHLCVSMVLVSLYYL